MKKNTNAAPARKMILRTIIAATVIFVLTACSQHPELPPNSAGDRFINIWEVDEIRVIGPDAPPANVGGVFALTRSSAGQNRFAILPARNFSDINDAWRALQLEYNAGTESGEPVKRIAAQSPAGNEQNRRQRKASRNVKPYGEDEENGKVIPVEPDVLEGYFLELKNGPLESLTGSMEINGKQNIITIFAVGVKDSPSERLLIFYCENERCDHSGMISARPK